MSRVKKGFPDASKHNPDPKYVATLVELAKERCGYGAQSQVAERIGVSSSTLKYWKSGTIAIPYPGQYALERLAGVL